MNPSVSHEERELLATAILLAPKVDPRPEPGQRPAHQRRWLGYALLLLADHLGSREAAIELLWRANAAGVIGLTRLDLPQCFDAAKVAESELVHPTGRVVHCIRFQPGAEPIRYR